MIDTPRYPTDHDSNAPEPEPAHRSVSGPPRRVYVLWIVGAAVVVLFIVLHLTGVLGPGGH